MSDFVMPENAHALRPVRFIADDELRYYTGTTFPRNGRAGCELYYRRCWTFGGVAESKEEAAGVCDVFDDEGDIIDGFLLNDKGLRYLYSALGCRVGKRTDGEEQQP